MATMVSSNRLRLCSASGKVTVESQPDERCTEPALVHVAKGNCFSDLLAARVEAKLPATGTVPGQGRPGRRLSLCLQWLCVAGARVSEQELSESALRRVCSCAGVFATATSS